MRYVLRLLVVLLSTAGLAAVTAAPSVAQDQLSLTATVTDTTVDPATGQVSITYTVTCNEYAIVSVAGSITQRGVTAYVPLNRFECLPGQPATFTITNPYADPLRPGPAILRLTVSGCAYDPELGSCTSQDSVQIETTIFLKPAAA